MYKEHTTTKVMSILDKNSGEIKDIEFVERVKYKSNGKQGWVKMYKNGYDDVMIELSSKLEMKMFIYIRDSFTARKPLVSFNQAEIAKKFNTTRSTVNRLMRKLVRLKFIHKDGSVYMMNPYMFVPYHGKIQELQDEWDAMI